jgi:hypothetical protein
MSDAATNRKVDVFFIVILPQYLFHSQFLFVISAFACLLKQKEQERRYRARGRKYHPGRVFCYELQASSSLQ